MKKKFFVIGIFVSVIFFGLSAFTTKTATETQKLSAQSVCYMMYSPGNYGTCLVENPDMKKLYDQANQMIQEGAGNYLYPPTTYHVYYNCETLDIYYIVAIL